MRRMILLVVLLSLAAPAPIEANPLCRWFGVCLYSSRGFELTVVDAETGRPLSGVYAWAEWVQYGYHGTNGPLMIQEATSGDDGRLTFPSWGVRQGSRAGIDLGYDPAVILFRSGYRTLLVTNDVPLPGNEFASSRTFTRTGAALRLQSFQGSRMEWLDQLRQLVFPPLSTRVSDQQLAQFRSQYLYRLAIVSGEADLLPRSAPEVEQFKSTLHLTRRMLQGVPQ